MGDWAEDVRAIEDALDRGAARARATSSAEGPHDYTPERWGAEDDAHRRGWPITSMDEALEHGYVKGDD